MLTRRRALGGILLLVIGFLAYRIVGRVLRGPGASGVPAKAAVPVAVTTVHRQSIENTLILTGDVRGLNEARVYPRVPGRLLRKIRQTGDVVKRGEVVALVDRDEPALQFAAAEVTSPLEGVLTRYFIDLGEAVTPATPICEVAEISPVKVVVNVAEKDLPRVRLGQLARFTTDAYPDAAFEGRVTRISEALNLASRSAEVEIYSQNPGSRLKPGMFARVEIVTEIHPDAVVVPRDAVAEAGGRYYCFVVNHTKADRRDLAVGVVKPDRLEILSGLEEGETLVRVGWHNLTEGMEIEVVERDTGAAVPAGEAAKEP